jgi:hypothetical protein
VASPPTRHRTPPPRTTRPTPQQRQPAPRQTPRPSQHRSYTHP